MNWNIVYMDHLYVAFWLVWSFYSRNGVTFAFMLQRGGGGGITAKRFEKNMSFALLHGPYV